jgi:hypothetical protein
VEVIMIYGIPAVGKLTVANELSKITGYKVFHNHLSIDLIHSFVEDKDEFFWKQVRKIRYDCLKIAKTRGVSLIMTSCYMGKGSDLFFKPLLQLAKKERIRLRFVHLVCDEKSVLNRVCDKHSRSELRGLVFAFQSGVGMGLC